ncbi:hypothetical protein Tco_1392808 [Tanacetum coccineum]
MNPIPSKPQPSVKQFTDQLFGKTSSNFLPTPPRETTPPRDESKGKEGTLSQEKFMDQLKEMKRLADLKELEKKSEEELKKLLNPATLKAQALKWEEHEEKKRKRTEFLKEMFVTEDIRVDGMNMNLIPLPGVVPIEGLVIKEPESRIFFMNRNTDLAFQ